MSGRLDSVRAGELLRRQAELQAEAEEVIGDLDLLSVLGRVGSAAEAWEVVQPLAAHPRVHEVRFLDQAGANSFSDDPRDGRHYLQHLYRTIQGDARQPDASLWLSGDPRENEMAYQEDLVRRLDPEARLAILWIKGLWVESPERRDRAYGREVSSVDIYGAVLERGVRTPEEFDAYLAAVGKPTRSLGRTGAA